MFKGALDLVVRHAAAEGGEAEGEVGRGGAVLVPGRGAEVFESGSRHRRDLSGS